MFHYDRGLWLTTAQLAIDVCRRQPRAFVSHAHTDHLARHEFALCTPATARLYQLRCGRRAVLEMPFREPIEWGGMRLTTYPAGHILGSAMLLAEESGQSLLYTGDFKLGPSATAEPAELPHADILIMECTFGKPEYRLPPRDEAIGQLRDLVAETLASGRPPVIHAYPLGKSQEVTKILTDAGFPVLQHPRIFEVSEVYYRSGVDLGDCRPYGKRWPPGHVVIVPPVRTNWHRLPGLSSAVSIAVTGWAAHPSTKYRLGVDHAIPLSDHADFDDLIAAAQLVRPRRIYCTHGPDSFVEHLRAAGFDAEPLEPSPQKRLF